MKRWVGLGVIADKSDQPGQSDGEVAEVLAIAVLVGAVVFGPALLVLLLKSRRRSRRRNATTTSAQIAGGWAELLDCANDAGTRCPPVACSSAAP